MSAIDTVIAALERHGCQGARGKFRCPAHEDCHPSLSVTARDGRVLLKCWAGCNTIDVLDRLGLTFGDLFDDAPGKDWHPATLRRVHASITDDGRARLGGVEYLPGGHPKTLAVRRSRDLCLDRRTCPATCFTSSKPRVMP